MDHLQLFRQRFQVELVLFGRHLREACDCGQAEQLKHVLDGCKVLDFTQVLAGPTATRAIAEIRAEALLPASPLDNAVCCKPFSISESLLNRERAGNLADFGCWRANLVTENACAPLGFVGIPYFPKQGNIAARAGNFLIGTRHLESEEQGLVRPV